MAVDDPMSSTDRIRELTRELAASRKAQEAAAANSKKLLTDTAAYDAERKKLEEESHKAYLAGDTVARKAIQKAIFDLHISHRNNSELTRVQNKDALDQNNKLIDSLENANAKLLAEFTALREKQTNSLDL
jgi:hypothetical protein